MVILSSYIVEFLTHRQVLPAFLLSLVCILYLVVTIKKDKLFNGKPSKLKALFSYRAWLSLVIATVAIWFGIKYSTVKKEAYYSSIDAGLRECFDELVEARMENYESYEIPSGMKVDIKPLKPEFKAIAITVDTLRKATLLEPRLNEELQKHGQFSKDMGAVDYIICYFQQWDTDYYLGNGKSYSTENAYVQFVDFKTHAVVDTVHIRGNYNPETMSASSKDFLNMTHEKNCYSSEQLYRLCMKHLQ